MDPITAATTIITFAAFIKDLIEIAQSIQRSIEMVSENRRRICDLTNDIVCTLVELANLTRGKEEAFQAPALLSALGNLKEDMLYVLSMCNKISSVQRPGFRGVRSQLKAWMKREDIEAEIRRLEGHVNKCYIQFTAISVARIEQSTARIEHRALNAVNTGLRLEQRLIGNHFENRITLQRVQGLISQMLIETPYGQNVMTRTVEVISSDPSHRKLESRYLSVETMHLVESLRQLMVVGDLVLDLPQSWDPSTPLSLVSSKPSSTRHILHSILGLGLEIRNQKNRCLSVGLMVNLELVQRLRRLGMYPEAVAWGTLLTQILRQVTIIGHRAGALAELAFSLDALSLAHEDRLQYEHAARASRQALDLWRHISAILPEVDNSQGLLASSVAHTRHLLKTGQPVAAISAAEEAVPQASAVIQRLIISGTPRTTPDIHKAVFSRNTYFLLAKALGAAGRSMEAYHVSKQAFEIALRLRIPQPYAPPGADVDFFLDQLCQVAEGGNFSLTMLEHCVVLFRNLSRTYFASLSHQFLWLFYAYAYLAPQENTPDFPRLVQNLRVFLEPNTWSPPPALNIFGNYTAYIGKFNHYGGIIRQAIYMFYLRPWSTNTRIPLLIKNIFLTHFDEVILVLRQLVAETYSVKDQHYAHVLMWVLDDITDLLPLLPRPHQLGLFGLMADITGHFREKAKPTSSRNDRNLFIDALSWSFTGFWMAGLLVEALTAAEESIKYLQSVLADDVDDEEKLHWFRLRRIFVLLDMGRTSRAIEMIQQTKLMNPDFNGVDVPSENDFWLHCVVRARTLQCVGRNREAQQMLRSLVTEDWRRYWTRKEQVLRSDFLLAEYAAVEGRDAGEALRDAERAVFACRNEVRVKIEDQEHALVHFLPILSNCLAAVGRNDEALAAAKEAASIYARNTSDPQVWKYILYTVRRQELGAVVFHTLSIRFQTSGYLQDSLANARKSVDLYRELVSIAPRHLPALARSLQNLASILWDIGVDGRAECITFCDEAAGIIRQVADKEAYFLRFLGETLSQLAGYLADQDRPTEASAALAEYAEVQRKIALLPPQTDFIFSVMEPDAGPQTPVDEAWTSVEVEEIPQKGIPAVKTHGVGSKMVTIPSTMPVALPAEHQQLSNAKNSAKIEESWSAKTRSIEVRFKLTGSHIDILWWTLVGILGILVGIASTVVWNRERTLNKIH